MKKLVLCIVFIIFIMPSAHAFIAKIQLESTHKINQDLVGKWLCLHQNQNEKSHEKNKVREDYYSASFWIVNKTEKYIALSTISSQTDFFDPVFAQQQTHSTQKMANWIASLLQNNKQLKQSNLTQPLYCVKN